MATSTSSNIARQAVRPALLARLDLVELGLVGRDLPALPAQLGQIRRNRPRHQHRRVVPWAIGLAVRARPVRVMVIVAAGVPAMGGNIDAAARREAIVDHHDLLVVAASGRMGAVEPHFDALGSPPADRARRRPWVARTASAPEIPLEDIDLAGPAARATAERRNGQAFRPCPFRPAQAAIRVSKSQPMIRIRLLRRPPSP